MLRKSFVLMMLLAASLIGISGATNHQPEVAIAQPQPQQPQQPPQQGQIQSPNTAPPTLGKRLTSPQGMQQQQKSDVPTAIQIQEDKALVDRLLPYIMQKIDGKILAQKLDTVTLLRKLDNGFIKRLLAEWVHPYMDLKVSVVQKEGQKNNVHMYASCGSDGTLVSGGFDARLGTVYSFKLFPNNEWYVASDHPAGSTSYANCLKAELGLLSEPRPPPPPPPSQPPGGFGK